MDPVKRHWNTDKTLFDFSELHHGLIDTSSVIYLDKIGVMDILRNSINLFTIEEVVKEFGREIPGVQVLYSESKNKTITDNILINTASHLKMPVITEDREISVRLAVNNHPHFNSLMIINFLFYKNIINFTCVNKYLNRLRIIARYNKHVWNYGLAVLNIIHSRQH